MSTAQQQQPTRQETATRTQQAGADFDRLIEKAYEPFSAFGSISQFGDAQRMAKMLCASNIVPENYRGENNIGNCVIALEIANRIGASVLAVMQNLYIVHGKPAWSSQFLISCVNASRRFSPLRYEVSDPEPEREVSYKYTVYVNREKTIKEGKIKIRNRTCRTWAVDKTGQKLYGPTVSIEMAIKEGWYTKEGSKWQTMEELMLHYRSATFFTRLYAPELTMGIRTEDEVSDSSESLSDSLETIKKSKASRNATAATEKPNFGASVVDSGAPTAGAATNQPSDENLSDTSEETNKPASAVNSSEAKQSELGNMKDPDPDANTPQGKLRRFLEDAGVTFDKFRNWAAMSDRLKDADSFGTWAELPSDFCESLAKDPKAISKCITLCR